MAASAADPFESAKANLRDTIKWLATLFSALAAAVVGGASLVGLTAVASGFALTTALVCGCVGVICLFVATGLALKLLTAETFHVGDIAKSAALRNRLDQYAADILPPEFISTERFLEERTRATTQLQANATSPDSRDYKDARDFLLSIDAPLSRLVNLAHFESMRMRFDAAIPRLFLLAMGALLNLGAYAAIVGSAKDGAAKAVSGSAPIVSVALNRSPASIGEVFAKHCTTTAAAMRVQVLGEPRANWMTVRVITPESCAGIVISVPNDLLSP